ncbi:MAG: hypothetical protein AAGA25_07150 [Planctomycetota bacterium]
MKFRLPDWYRRSPFSTELLTLWLIALFMPAIFLWDAYGNNPTISTSEAWLVSLACWTLTPAITVAVWLLDRYEEKQKQRLNQLPRDEQEREEFESRRAGRIVACVFAIGGGLVFVFFMNGQIGGVIPVRYLGHLFICVGLLGLAGVNVFFGGPLDRRLDERD